MEGLSLIPMELLFILPRFDGDRRLLNFFVNKCEYVIRGYRGGAEQEECLYHVISSRLTGNAALIAERDNIASWPELKNVLIQQFTDRRSEDSIAIELETLKLKQNESYLDFYNRIQHTLNMLLAKVKQIPDDNVRMGRIAYYNDSAKKVFLFNLPEHLIHIVRLRDTDSLESLLNVVLDVVDYQQQYTTRNKMSQAVTNQNFVLPAFRYTNKLGQTASGVTFGASSQAFGSQPQVQNVKQSFSNATAFQTALNSNKPSTTGPVPPVSTAFGFGLYGNTNSQQNLKPGVDHTGHKGDQSNETS